MDCNKDEATRALNLAEKKMEAKDFEGAKKFVLKAQKLFPGIDYIPYLLAVCEVHCSSGVTGLEDWYSILQVEVTADEASIKKQYRKLALRLHPDKNKFAGAEAAFKLIEEAHRTLSDRSKRSLYDMKRRPGILRSQPPSQHQTRKPPVKMQRVVPNSTNHSTVPLAPVNSWQQSGSQATSSEPFWTICPFCGIKYQYHRPVLNKIVRCQKCQSPFTAHDVYIHRNAGFQNNFEVNSRNKPKEPMVPVRRPEGADKSENKPIEKVQVNNHATKENTVKFENVNLKNLNKKEKASVYSDNQKGKRKKADLTDTESSSDEEVIMKEGNCNGHGDTVNHELRRSTRQKQDITYNENHTDDEEETKHTDENIAFTGDDVDEFGNHKEDAVKCEQKVGKEEESDPEINFIVYSDTEFFDFEKNKVLSVFSKNQIWALYDDLDGMPRFYAKIKSVSNFKIKYTWLELVAPVSTDQEKWVKGNLPVGCGNYKLDSEVMDTSETSLFSHILSSNYCSKKRTYAIFPRKGEVWALYKDWDVNWSEDPEKHRCYMYEIVEILSDYTPVSGIETVPMIMVKGFVSVFTRAINEKSCLLHIQPQEMLKFSHMVPSYKMTGEERKGIPNGSYELDTASLPGNFSDVFPSISYDDINTKVDDKDKDSPNHLKVANTDMSSSILKPNGIGVECHQMHVDVSQEKVGKKSQMAEEKNQMLSSTETKNSNAKIETSRMDSYDTRSYTYEDSEFFNFDSQKSIDKIRPGQIWSLYSEEVGFPNYYAMVTEVEKAPLKLHLNWLEFHPTSKEEKRYKKEVSVGCGKFKILSGKKSSATFDTLDAFSHEVVANSASNSYCFIHPEVGQVWAIYRNWSFDWGNTFNSDQTKYHIVVVISKSNSTIEASHLEKVKDHNTIYRRKTDRDGTLTIPHSDILCFSHRIPCFQLTNENEGKLHGYWELDLASTPEL